MPDLRKDAEAMSQIAVEVLREGFAVVPLTETQQALFISIGGRIYNQGCIDTLQSLISKKESSEENAEGKQ